MKIKLLIAIVTVMVLLVGCTATPQDKIIIQQNADKMDQATKVMEQTKVPTFTKSLERENIRKRLIVSNDANTLQWIYPMSAGRVIGRFPVKGKVTSGGKRLTSNQTLQPFQYGSSKDGGSSVQYDITEAPDEMGTYGSSGDYVFWFDPADRISQHRGDYFVSVIPYKIDLGYGTISTEIDTVEQGKIEAYKKQITESNAKEPTPEPTATQAPVASKVGK